MKITKYDKPLGHVRPSVPKWDNAHTPVQKKGKQKKRREARGPDVVPRYTLKPKEKMAMSWWHLCISTGKCYSAWWYQVNRYGMDPLEALKKRHHPVVMSLRDICKRVGINPETFQKRRDNGWGFRAALLTPPDEILSEAAKRQCSQKRKAKSKSNA